MTVKDLIKELLEYDQTYEVVNEDLQTIESIDYGVIRESEPYWNKHVVVLKRGTVYAKD